MKAIRLFVALLLVATGVLHLVLYVKAPSEPASLGMLVFGIIYAATGLLLFTKKMLAVYAGLSFPLIGMTSAIIKFGIKDLVSMMTLLLLIDVIAIGCCAYLILNRRKGSDAVNPGGGP